MNQLIEDNLKSISRDLITNYFPSVFTPRPVDAHKGILGNLIVLGGSRGMEGALILAGKSALKMGCGKVYLSFADPNHPLNYLIDCPEIILSHYEDCLSDKVVPQAVVIGCGLGSSLLAQQLLQNSLIHFCAPIVLDADALNLLAARKMTVQLSWRQHILTPHPKEAARLLGCSVSDIQVNRIKAAKTIAKKYSANVVLKGYHTVVYTPQDDTLYVNDTGNSGLATSGAGDVLSGILGSLLAQGYSLPEVARAGVFLHGLAADWLVSKHVGPIGLTASEIIDAARYVRNALTYHLVS